MTRTALSLLAVVAATAGCRTTPPVVLASPGALTPASSQVATVTGAGFAGP